MKFTIIPIAIALFLLVGCDNSQTSARPQMTPEVGVVTLKGQPVSVISELTGRTTASLSAEVRPQVGGIIQKRLFTEGDRVKAGQALYQIDPASYRAAYNEAAAGLKQAQSLTVADCQKARRYTQLVKDNGVSLQDADDAQSTGQGQRRVEKSRAGERPHQPELDHRQRADCRTDWHLLRDPGGAGLCRSGYGPGDDPRAGDDLRRSHAIER
jgi:membrane fusion protein (multidrug efflux system)